MSTRGVVAALFVMSAAAASARTAQADVMWEHIGTLQTSARSKPLLRIKMYNTWTPQRHRLLLNYAFSPSLAGRAGMMNRGMNFPPVPMLQSLTPKTASSGIRNYGSVGFVQRLDDDRLLAYESQSRTLISEPRMALKKRLRFNPWKKLAPELSNQNAPALSEEQRTRLKAEIGALTAPIRKSFAKTYFRALPGYKTYGSLIGRGYRLTQLVNVGGVRRNAMWVRTTTEWWIAPQSESDNAISSFETQTRNERREMGGLTNSMWLNEYIALAAIPSDPILRAAYNTFRIPEGAPEGAFAGTPLTITTKVTLPPLQRARFGDVLFTLRLASRSTDALANTVFNAPGGYKTYDIQPALKKLDPILDGSAWISLWDKVLKD